MKRAVALLAGLMLLAGCSGPSSSPARLVEQLDGPQAFAALAQLEQTGDSATFQALVEGTRSPSPRVRAHCVRLLGTKRDTTAIPAVRPLLDDPDPLTRVQAARALVSLADPQELLEWLPELQPTARDELIAAMVQAQLEDIVPMLMGLVQAPAQPPGLRAAGCRGLQQVASQRLESTEQAVPLLLELARTGSSDPELRAKAIEAYGAVAGPAAVGELSRWLERPDLQGAALRGLGHTRSPAALQLLSKIVKNRDLPVDTRALAIRCLRESPHLPDARALLLASMKDREARIRGSATRALRAFAGQPGVESALREARRIETDPDVARQLEISLK